MKKKLSYLCAAVLFLLLCLGSAAAYAAQNRRTDYPGTGVYDLTAFFPCDVREEGDGQSVEILPYLFNTNSTEIRVRNNEGENVWISLYDASDETGQAIGRGRAPAGKTLKFTNLTQARNYCVRVEAAGKKYAVTLTD